MIDIESLVRDNIKTLKPYSSARDEFTGKDGVFLDANENPYGKYNRYPDPYQVKLKNAISDIKKVNPDNLFIGNGSDESIDLLYRIFCNPSVDKAMIFPPTYGMYKVSADINNINLIEINLLTDFQLDTELIIDQLSDPELKLVFICSPNNPTGNSINENDIIKILSKFNGIVVIDEAYIDFSIKQSWTSKIEQFNNLVVLQTMSKAWGLAGARVGITFANPEIIKYLNRIKPPYNISSLNQEHVLETIKHFNLYEHQIASILSEKDRIINELGRLANVEQIYPSDANFVLVRIKNADLVYKDLLKQNLVVRNRSKVIENCLRITIGTREENQLLIKELKNIADAKSTIY